jgi:hypothetical protein
MPDVTAPGLQRQRTRGGRHVNRPLSVALAESNTRPLRAAIVARLEGRRLVRETADEWCTRWEAESDGRHAQDYWQRGAVWIAEQGRPR